MEKAEAIDYVESVLENLEETESVYRTFVEKGGLDESETERLLDMLNDIDTDDIIAGIDAIEHLSTDDSSNE